MYTSPPIRPYAKEIEKAMIDKVKATLESIPYNPRKKTNKPSWMPIPRIEMGSILKMATTGTTKRNIYNGTPAPIDVPNIYVTITTDN